MTTEMTAAPAGQLRSADGTTIAYWRAGDGKPLLLVHGTTSDHTTFNELVPHLTGRRTVVTFDRRGRGQSGDTQGRPYGIEDEFDDVLTVAREVASWSGQPVDVFGHSFGAFLALGAALRDSSNIRALVLYSPGFGASYPEGALERIEQACASDDRDGALQVVLSDIVGMPERDILALRNSPVWQVRVGAAGTVPRECRVDQAFLPTYQDQLGQIRVPVLVVSGATNTPGKRETNARMTEAMPNAEFVEMAGEGHAAHHTAPAALADIMLDFYERAQPSQ